MLDLTKQPDAFQDLPNLPIEDGVRFAWIPDYPGYFVSDIGDAYSFVWHRRRKGDISFAARPIKLKPAPLENGHLHVGLTPYYKTTTYFTIHALVLMAFIGPRPDGMEGCHWDGNPVNNKLENLRWDTPSNNNLDKRRHGTAQQGEQSRLRKLTTGQAEAIRRRYSDGEKSSAIAAEYGVHERTVRRVAKGATWFHLLETNAPTPPVPAIGEDNPISRLTEAEVIEIRRRCADGEPQKQVAKDYCVTYATVNRVVTRKIWKHI